mgnify:CR=1 FL=1|tara:strand:+ start:107 stop:421 length:315 start_codon:yes stop_codon:yes gene_type:complete
MKYLNSIFALIILNFFSVILLLYISSLSRDLERNNLKLKKDITYIEEQININEIEYSLYNNYNYLKKLQKIYLDYDNIDFNNSRVSINDLKENNIKNFYTVGIN